MPERRGQGWFSTTRRRTAPARGWAWSPRPPLVRIPHQAAVSPWPPRHPPARRSSPSRCSGRCSRSCLLAGGYWEQRPWLASPAPVPAAPLTLAAPRCSGGWGLAPAGSGIPSRPRRLPPARRAAPRRAPRSCNFQSESNRAGGGEPGVSSANEGSLLAAGSQGRVGGLRGEDHCGELLRFGWRLHGELARRPAPLARASLASSRPAHSPPP